MVDGGINNENLDYYVEDGECSKSEDKKSKQLEDKGIKVEEPPEELEEGEILDDDDLPRPETFESRNVCKFFLRGRCTWGVTCRFLHCVFKDNGNYSKLELVTAVNSERTTIGDVYESETTSSPEIMFSRHPPTRSKNTYEPVYSRIWHPETDRSYYYDPPHLSSDYYEHKSRTPNREVDVPREKTGRTDSWMRSKSATGAKRRRNNSSSSSSTSESSSSSSSSTSRSSRGSKRSHRHRENQRSLNRKGIKELAVDSRLDKFGRNRKRKTTDHAKARKNGRTKRSVTSSSRSSSTSNSSLSESDNSVSKTRNINKKRPSDSSFKKYKFSKIRQRSSSRPVTPTGAHFNNKKLKKKVLLQKLHNIERAIANYSKS